MLLGWLPLHLVVELKVAKGVLHLQILLLLSLHGHVVHLTIVLRTILVVPLTIVVAPVSVLI